MATPLEKAKRDPDSIKARILRAAAKVFGEYGFHGTTTRMIAKEVGIDISTLHYHWGDKSDLYQGVLMEIRDAMGAKLVETEKKVKGKPLPERIDIAIEELMDFLFERPEVSNLTLFRYFTKTRESSLVEVNIPEYIADIAYSMGLATSRDNVSDDAQLKVIAMMNAFHNFVSGEGFFRELLDMEPEAYRIKVKETLKFYSIAPFVSHS
ncbi:hypothetical protein DSLASN_17130 [Desulfoluna limicola]|uniref:HTH tetR-type domain-containing protein n=1 Tax=Desulfoluna limicola TaxID=2810562 RepID=A0ABN6F3L1_9BACT|nr:TetR/AcrR family transcriptional regulator [Desulfoluna limicola]BCS96081.1 hypothetical protein DSLASN_17130 [Desulfoluna limicola]